MGWGREDGFNSRLVFALLKSPYPERQLQRCDNSVMTLEILFSLKTMELQPIFNENSIASITAELSLTVRVKRPLKVSLRFCKLILYFEQMALLFGESGHYFF